MNRVRLRELAEDRVLDAEALLAAGRRSAAYHLAGYAVECGLKACVLAHVERTGVIFRDRKFAETCWTRDVEALVKAADLDAERGVDVAANVDLRRNWACVSDWTETSRYERKTKAEARLLFDADAVNEVLPWIRNRW